MELKEALETLLEYQETLVFLLATHVSTYDADKVLDAIEEVTSYLNEGGEKLE